MNIEKEGEIQDNLTGSFRFQEWPVYRRALQISRQAYGIRTIRGPKTGLTSLLDQLRRAANSVPLNLAEGYSRVSKRDKQSFLRIAMGSTYECAAVLDIMKEIEAIEKDSHKKFMNDLFVVASMIGGLINFIEKNEGRYRKT